MQTKLIDVQDDGTIVTFTSYFTANDDFTDDDYFDDEDEYPYDYDD